MIDQTLETLEHSALLDLLARHVQTPMGRRRVFELRPMLDPQKIEYELSRVAECRQLLAAGQRLSFGGIEDPDASLSSLRIEGLSLTPLQILALERLLTAGMELRSTFSDSEARRLYPHLAEVATQIPDLQRLVAGLRGKLLPDGAVADNASPELRSIRRDLQTARGRIHRFLESVIRRHPRAVQEEIITFRGDRFVIPVRTDSRGQVPGVVHGLSSSGQTTYIEPLAAIDQNNEIVRLHELEQMEIARILMALTELIRSNLGGVRTTAEAIAAMDFEQAKAQLSAEFGCVRPRLSDTGRLSLQDARHILLEHNLRLAGENSVPISLTLSPRERVLVVSGPNAGGKTVVLKTVGLVALMAQMGIHVPAAEAEMPIYSAVFADIGDQQSISANLSTFTAHMRNISEMACRVSPSALVLIDEVGTGTDPDEGAALAVAILDFFRRTGATTIATTHYNQLKAWASGVEGVVNASVEFDEQTLQPTYRLLMGIAGASSGLEIACRMDVPAEIIAASRNMLNPDHAQAGNYLKRIKAQADELQALKADLEDERRALDAERRRIADEFQRKEEARGAEFDRALAAVIDDFRAESHRLIGGLNDRALAERMSKAALQRSASLRRKAAQLRQSAGGRIIPAASAPQTGRTAAGAELQEGDRVHVTALGKGGTVESVHDDGCTVLIGPLRYRARRSELEVISRAEPRTKFHETERRPAEGEYLDQEPAREINVIGLQADEALERVDKFLDQAYYAGVDTIRIIHGHGKGTLRRAIAGLLTGHLQVEKFQPAPPHQGGSGATVVELRK